MIKITNGDAFLTGNEEVIVSPILGVRWIGAPGAPGSIAVIKEPKTKDTGYPVKKLPDMVREMPK